MAIKVHDLFLEQDEQAVDDGKMVEAVITAREKFDS